MVCTICFGVIYLVWFGLFFIPQLLRSTGRVRGTLPLTVLKVLASLACHGKDNQLLSGLEYIFFCDSEPEIFMLVIFIHACIEQVPSNSTTP